ncbi:hypothetical protein [Paenibacillus polymyxa]|uniref:hypothetical protein n=1 Tax=Paenibacillus polymyxa TaxID=1406 RepID=UPI0020257F1F|nr:hypothetical protein [Paenibacillus polymyxa]WDZ55879.1 hypothetical protein MF622_09725 [Paenibacillus polymyxa]
MQTIALLKAHTFCFFSLFYLLQANANVRQLDGSDAKLSAVANYGLPEKTKDGIIFHEWNL